MVSTTYIIRVLFYVSTFSTVVLLLVFGVFDGHKQKRQKIKDGVSSQLVGSRHKELKDTDQFTASVTELEYKKEKGQDPDPGVSAVNGTLRTAKLKSEMSKPGGGSLVPNDDSFCDVYISKEPPLLADANLEYPSYLKKGAKRKILVNYQQQWLRKVDLSDCCYGNCVVTTDVKEFIDSDAVIYYLGDHVPDIHMLNRPKNQIWILYTLEPPSMVPFKKHKEHIFNWTMTYRLDSDIPYPYGYLQTKEKLPQRDYHAIYANKTKFAAWVVSHCKSQSKRNEYVKLLQKYIPIDIYGRCGDKHKSGLGKTEKQKILKDYKFYLSFENSNCRDYVTEKVFRYLPEDLVLVARGAKTYNTLLPPDLIVDTGQFKTVKDLADYLLLLNSTESAYIDYLKAKDRYNVMNWLWKNALCQVCRRLDNAEQYRRTYKDVNTWFRVGSCFVADDLK